MSAVLYETSVPGLSACAIAPGQRVLTVDNSLLGTVKETSDTHFKVNVRFRRDYWLSRDLVAFVDAFVIGLTFRSDETELYKIHRPLAPLSDAPEEYSPPAEDQRRWENGPYPH